MGGKTREGETLKMTPVVPGWVIRRLCGVDEKRGKLREGGGEEGTCKRFIYRWRILFFVFMADIFVLSFTMFLRG